MEYKVLKNKNGKFCPRIINDFTGPSGCWFERPIEYDNLEDAVNALVAYKDKKDRQKQQKEEFVFTLE